MRDCALETAPSTSERGASYAPSSSVSVGASCRPSASERACAPVADEQATTLPDERSTAEQDEVRFCPTATTKLTLDVADTERELAELQKKPPAANASKKDKADHKKQLYLAELMRDYSVADVARDSAISSAKEVEVSTEVAMTTAKFAVLRARLGVEISPKNFNFPKELKCAQAVLNALKAKKQKPEKQTANLADATNKGGTDTEGSDESWYTKLWNFIKPSSTSGKIAYTVGAATAAAAVVHKYRKDQQDQHTSESRKKWLAAAGLAATGVAAFSGYKAWEAYQARQHPHDSTDEYLDEDEELSTSEKDNSQAVASRSTKTKSGKTTKAKGSNWMIWAVVIVLGLVAIGGAVYYFLFMEEGSEEDPVPEGMDLV